MITVVKLITLVTSEANLF